MKSATKVALRVALVALIVAGPAGAGDLFTKCKYGKMKRNQPEPAAVMTSEAAGALTPIPLDAVRMLDKDTAKTVFVQSLHTRRSPTQTVEVLARVFNCAKEPVKVVARTHFLDAEQFPIEPVSAWRTIVLQPGTLNVYSERSTSTRNVAHYLIELKKD